MLTLFFSFGSTVQLPRWKVRGARETLRLCRCGPAGRACCIKNTSPKPDQPARNQYQSTEHFFIKTFLYGHKRNEIPEHLLSRKCTLENFYFVGRQFHSFENQLRDYKQSKSIYVYLYISLKNSWISVVLSTSWRLIVEDAFNTNIFFKDFKDVCYDLSKSQLFIFQLTTYLDKCLSLLLKFW